MLRSSSKSSLSGSKDPGAKELALAQAAAAQKEKEAQAQQAQKVEMSAESAAKVKDDDDDNDVGTGRRGDIQEAGDDSGNGLNSLGNRRKQIGMGGGSSGTVSVTNNTSEVVDAQNTNTTVTDNNTSTNIPRSDSLENLDDPQPGEIPRTQSKVKAFMKKRLSIPEEHTGQVFIQGSLSRSASKESINNGTVGGVVAGAAAGSGGVVSRNNSKGRNGVANKVADPLSHPVTKSLSMNGSPSKSNSKSSPSKSGNSAISRNNSKGNLGNSNLSMNSSINNNNINSNQSNVNSNDIDNTNPDDHLNGANFEDNLNEDGGLNGGTTAVNHNESTMTLNAGESRMNNNNKSMMMSQSDSGGPNNKSDANKDKARITFKSSLSSYNEGVLETEFLEKVISNDENWVVQCLSCFGKELLYSDWAGGLCRTSILYAAKSGKPEMCKILLAYGGTELLAVKDLKSRDAQYFARQHGLDLKKIMKHGLRIDCWNFSVLNELEKSNRILQAREKKEQSMIILGSDPTNMSDEENLNLNGGGGSNFNSNIIPDDLQNTTVKKNGVVVSEGNANKEDGSGSGSGNASKSGSGSLRVKGSK